MSVTTYEQELTFQTNIRRASIEFLKLVSDLWYDQTIELVLFRNQLINRKVSEVLDLLNYATEFVEKPISIYDAVEIAKTLKLLKLPPSRIDIGKLVYEYQIDTSEHNIYKFLSVKLANALSSEEIEPRDVILYGFGRIGRLVARELMGITGKGKQLRLRAIVTRGEITNSVLEKRASLLKNDSIHGDFYGTVSVNYETKGLVINGTTVNMISASSPEEIDYTKFGITNALVIDNTGAFRDKNQLNRHLSSKGVDKVLLTAPGKGVPNIVYGVKHKNVDPNKESIVSAASCTTNAISPVLKVIEDNFGIVNGHLETIHAYTNDQNLVDNMHNKYRRGRAAALNMVITETGAGQAVSKAIPSLEGKLTSNAIRVPVPNGSLAILKMRLNKKVTVKKINDKLRRYALEGDLVEQIKYSLDNELVSSDIVGSPAPAIFDSKATIVTKEGKDVVLYIWYDNEFGYSQQVIRLAKHIAKVKRYTYY